MFGWFEPANNQGQNERKLYGAKYGCAQGCKYLKRTTFGHECTQGVCLAWGLKSECKYFQA